MADDASGPRFVGDPEPDPVPAADPKAARKAAGPRFKHDQATAASQRTTAIVVVLFLLAALAGVLVALPSLLTPPPRPRLLTVHVQGYDSPGWGVAAWAQRDADALVAAFPDPESASADKNFLQSDKLRARLADVAARLAEPEAAKRPLVLSVSGLAAVRPDGAPCLLPTDADPFDPARWLPIDDILKALATDRPVQRLLLLDLARPTADPFLGRPAETVSTAVCELLRRRQAEGSLPCGVFASAGLGEVSLPAARARQSVFGLYLSDALAGAAAGDGSRGDEVTVGGLTRFVTSRVDRYAREVYGRTQRPQYFAPASDPDFVLASRVTPQAPAVPAEPPKPDEYAYPGRLRDAWKKWDGLLAAGGDRDEPEGFARLTAALLRAERLWLGTDDVEFAGGVCDQAFNSWADARRASRPAGRPADEDATARAWAGRWRLAAREDKPSPPELSSLLARYLSARTAPDAKPEGYKAEKQAWDEKAAADPTATRLVWRKLADDQEPGRAKIDALAKTLGELPAGDPPPLERLLAKFLAERRFQEVQGPSYPAEAVTAWLRAEDRLGRVLAAGPVGFTERRRALDDAEEQRKAGAELLFQATGDGAVKAATAKLLAAGDGFEKVAAAAGPGPKLAAAVPPLLRAVLAHQRRAAEAGGEEFDRWQEAVRLLDRLLAGRRPDPVEAAKLADEAVRATERLADTAAPARVEEFERRPTPWGKPEVVRSALALVAGPTLPADGRAKAWGLIRREWWRKHDEVRTADAADVDSRAKPVSPQQGAVNADPAERLREDAAEALLRLALGGDRTDPTLWRTEVPREAVRAVQGQDWAAANRLLRVVPPAVAAVRSGMPPAAPLDTPAAADRAAYREWVKAQLRDGYKTPVGGVPLWDKIDPNRALRNPLAAPD